MERTYIAIDLKSFYASVECAERHFDPLSTHLVVADPSRTEKTICLAVSPSLKAYGISGRARLFEVVQRVKEINARRMKEGIRRGVIRKNEEGQYAFTSFSFDAPTLEANPNFGLEYFVAPPRMKLYEEYSTRVFSIYMKYVSSEDIHVYSIVEAFLDVTGYLKTYGLTPRELAMTMIREVLYTTGITATAGIGTNLYLAKIAMDIVAKHVPADKDGVRIAELDEQRYRELLWCHQPLTDFWRVGGGIARRLAALQCFTMGDIARMSLSREDLLYGALGINAELLIDHAWGWEPVTIPYIKEYRPETTSLSSGQVLKVPYEIRDARLIVQEMAELLALDLVRKHVVTRQITVTIGYDRESLTVLHPGNSMKDTVYAVAKTGRVFRGTVMADPYGRPHPKHAHGTGNLDHWTASSRRLMETATAVFDRVTEPDLLVRRIMIAACNLIPEDQIPPEGPEQLDMFTDYEELSRRREAERLSEAREKRLQQATLKMQERFGKNAVLKGINLEEAGTTIERNRLIGGHKA